MMTMKTTHTLAQVASILTLTSAAWAAGDPAAGEQSFPGIKSDKERDNLWPYLSQFGANGDKK